MKTSTFDNRVCALGEGPLWHPERRQLYWFDILGKRLLTREGGVARHWLFEEMVSAAGWVDGNSLLVACETGLDHFDLTTGKRQRLVALEADNPVTRSNDGRADPWGGFWIGTMGKKAENGAGGIYRYFQGELRRLFSGITTPNAICFAADGRCAYFADTAKQMIWRQALRKKDGWPEGDPVIHLNLGAEGLKPDGAVVDREGYLWNAQWGASRVCRYDLDGRLDIVLRFPATQVSCPAFGGKDLEDLYVTSATVGLDDAALQDQPRAGMTFVSKPGISGQAEHKVRL